MCTVCDIFYFQKNKKNLQICSINHTITNKTGRICVFFVFLVIELLDNNTNNILKQNFSNSMFIFIPNNWDNNYYGKTLYPYSSIRTY